MGKKFGLNFDGVAELSEKLEQIGGDLKKVAEEALEFIPGDVNPKLHAAMQKHKGHGVTEKSIVEGQQVKWTGNVASIDVGFDLKKGGMPSIFLMYGTKVHGQPHVQPDKKLYDAVYGSKNKRQVQKIQEEAFMSVAKKVIG